MPSELESFDLNSGRHKQPDFLALNPMGKVPLVIVDGVPVAETGAIALYLADRFPAAGLAPAIDDPLRPAYLRWVLFSGNVIEPGLGQFFFKWDVRGTSRRAASRGDRSSRCGTC
jgi:glutathione S-transferase